MAGQNLGTKSGVLEVGSDGSVEVDDKEVIAALQNSGFRLEDKKSNTEVLDKFRQVVAEEKEVIEALKTVHDDEEAIEVDDVAEYSVKEALKMVHVESDIDILEAWKESELSQRNRKSVIRSIEDRMSEVGI